MRLYLAGPISGVANKNSFTFGAVTQFLRAYNYDVINPLEVPACTPDVDSPHCGVAFEQVGLGEYTRYEVAKDDDHTWGCYLRHDLQALLTCDGVALLRGWSASRGARLEQQVGEAVGMKCWPWDMWLEDAGAKNIGTTVDSALLRAPWDTSHVDARRTSNTDRGDAHDE